MAQANQDSLNQLKSMHDEVNRKIEEFKLSQRQKFLRKLYPLIKKWKGPLPNLKDIFTKEEIDWLLSESVKSPDGKIEPSALIDFVIRTGYRDEPDLDTNGKPISRRTTPIHHAIYEHYECVPELFKIYDRFDVNYIDEESSDYSHFHIVCDSGYDDIASKFLDAGQDPDCLLARGSHESFSDPPLYSAMRLSHTEVLRLLLRRGADPNIANVEGRTPLHLTCNTRELDGGKYWAKMMFEICDEVQRAVQLDPRDKEGKTPLHLAVANRYEDMIEFLLRRGADPNVADAEGLTPLHVICNYDRSDRSDLAAMLFEICDDVHKTVQIDARDKLGRTPLQWAVANCQPDVLDVLLDRGADLSGFVFPTGDHFEELSRPDKYFVNSSRLRLASGALNVVERLEKRGYELARSDALTIMNAIAKSGLFEISTEPDTHWFTDYNDEEFETRAKKLMMNATLSLYDVSRLRPEKAEKLLTYTDFMKFAKTNEFLPLSGLRSHRPYYAHLSEILLGGFFRRWALDPVLELTRYQLPILCCDVIIKQLSNKDLHHICLAAAGRSSRG